MITTGITPSAKMLMLQLLSQEQFKLALYDATADIGPDTLAYTSVGETSGKGYKPGGVALKNARVWDDRGTACLTWDSPVLPVASISANGFLIYIPSRGNKAVFAGAWNATYTSTEGPFTINIASDCIVLE
jgi:hypothetical protein